MLFSAPAFSSLLSRRLGAAACVVIPLSFGLYALALGQDANWDLKNYHWYNPYAFLTDRLAQDIGPAHTPTYYNPTLDVPLYLAAQVLSARTIAFFLGVLQGLNFVVLYRLGLCLFAPVPDTRRHAVAVLAALAGVLGGGHLGLVGTTFYDNIVSLFVLGSIVVVVETSALRDRADPAAPWLGLAMAGALVGTGAGLKLPTAVFAVGLCAALLFVGPGFQRRIAHAFVFGLGVLAGFAVFAGHWTLHLWQAYANPVFPYFNALFDSPMGLSASYRDTRFVPTSLIEAVTFPLRVAFEPYEAGEIKFRDWRIATAYVALLATVAIALARPAKLVLARLDARRAAYVFAAAGLSYLVWLALFGIYRYVIPLEMLSPLLVVAALALWPIGERATTGLIVGVLAALVLTGKPGTWQRVPFAEKFIETTAPAVGEKSLVLMAGFEPTAWLIPAFPPDATFVRIQGYGNHPDDGDTGINNKVRARIEAQAGAFYILTTAADREHGAAMLARYGLALTGQPCRPVVSNLGDYIQLCDVTRRDATPQDTPPRDTPQ